MKILITGGNGFIGKYLHKYYAEYGHHVLAPKRDELDLLDLNSVHNYFTAHPVDVVIHTALYGRELINSDEIDMFNKNMEMFDNLYAQRSQYKKFINLGSGYEYDISRNIDNADEDDILYVEPSNPYGKVKNLIAQRCRNTDNFYTLRLFGVLHYTESGSRFFRKLYESREFHITENKRCDYFNLEDLPTVIDLILNDQCKHREMNCVYENKYTLAELAKLFCDVKNIDPSRIIIDSEGEKSYTGDNSKIASYNLPFLGLELAMLRY
jgi:nucleoside-diphosphate-sugar epimerase